MSTASSRKSTIRTKTYDWRNRCLNCSFLIPRTLPRVPRHLMEQVFTPPMNNILQSWIFPTQLSPESIICTECFEILQKQVNAMTDGSVLPLSAFGHRRVCFPCGNSILRAPRIYPVPQDRQERSILQRLVPLHLVSRMEHVCRACWRAATREVQRQQQHGSNRPSRADAVPTGNPGVPEPAPLPPQRQQVFGYERKRNHKNTETIKSEAEGCTVLHNDVQIKQEPSYCEIDIELDLYAFHHVKEELVIGPVVLQKPGEVKEELVIGSVVLQKSGDVKEELVIKPVVLQKPGDVKEELVIEPWCCKSLDHLKN